MTKAKRMDTNKIVGCFPDETLADALAKVFLPCKIKNQTNDKGWRKKVHGEMVHGLSFSSGFLLSCLAHALFLSSFQLLQEEDGKPTNFKVVGKTPIPGELERPVRKFHGRDIEITTEKTTVRVHISDA
jgi:hypothetical protein